MFHKTICWLVSASMVFLNSYSIRSYASSADNSSRPTYEAALKQFEQFMNLIKVLRSNIDRSQFDLDVLLEDLDFDAERIISFVKNDIYYQQYAGVLRGAQGTLRSMSGNALDQAILLSTLLKSAGFDARISRARISTEQAEKLLNQMSLTKQAKSPYKDKQAFNAALKKMWELSGLSASNFEEILHQPARSNSKLDQKYIDIVNQDTDFILNNLAHNNVKLGNSDVFKEITEEARDYFWVEYRLGVSSEWLSVHPVLQNPIAGFDLLKIDQTLSETIPDELLHKFKFEAVVEQRIAGKLVTHSIIDPWERPTANIVGKGMTFTNVSLSLVEQADKGTLTVAEEGNDIFIPVFLGNSSSQTFDLYGNVVPIDAAASSYAAIFATDADKLTSAASSLDSLGRKKEESNDSLIALSSLKIKLSLIEPGGEVTSYWRNVYTEQEASDLADTEKRLNVYRSLTQNYSFMVGIGAESQASILDNSLQAVEAKSGLIRSVLNQMYGKTDSGSSTNLGESDLSWIGLSTVFGAFDLFNSNVEYKTYRHKPSLFIYRNTLPFNATQIVHTDILQDKRRSIQVTKDQSEKAAQDMVRMGVWASLAEGLLVGNPDNEIINTHSVFEKHKANGSGFQVIQTVNENAISGLEVSELARRNLSHDLKRGFTVIVPDSKGLAGADNIAWWRIDPSTGETLGIGETGEGVAITMELILEKIAIVGFIGGAVFAGCLLIAGPINAARPNTVTGGDCVTAGMGAGLGAAVGPTIELAEIVIGTGIGAATSALGKLVDAWGGME